MEYHHSRSSSVTPSIPATVKAAGSSRVLRAAVTAALVTGTIGLPLLPSPLGSTAEAAALINGAIESPGVHQTPQTLSGQVIELTENGGKTWERAGGERAFENVTVYTQWQDGEDGWISPVYYSTTEANGQYTIYFPELTDENGVDRAFSADDKLLDVWIDYSAHAAEYELG